MFITSFLIFALLVGFYVAWNIGANDVANAVGPAVGSGAMTLRQAVIVSAIFEFAGAFLLGGHVSETLESGMIHADLYLNHQHTYILGMLSALVATGVWLQIASYFGWPVSTTHTVVGGVIGFGAVFGGLGAIEWPQVSSIAASWVVSPLFGGAVAYLIFSWIRRKILYHPHPHYAACKYTPSIVFTVFFTLLIIAFFDGIKGIKLSLPGPYLLLCCLLGALVAATIARIGIYFSDSISPYRSREGESIEMGLSKALKHLSRVEAASSGEMSSKAHQLYEETQGLLEKIEKKDEILDYEYSRVEKIFSYLQIVIACFMAFAHGSNDVANAIGPLSAVINGIQGNPLFGESVSVWLLLLGGIGIVAGLATWGWRVIQTIGNKITALTPSRGFAAGFGASITIVLASKMGLPISTTHVIVGAILGVGFARGIGAINLSMLREIVISWIVTLPAGAGLTVCFFYLFQFFLSGTIFGA